MVGMETFLTNLLWVYGLDYKELGRNLNEVTQLNQKYYD